MKLVPVLVMSLVTFAWVKQKHPNDWLTIEPPTMQVMLQDELVKSNCRNAQTTAAETLWPLITWFLITWFFIKCRHKSHHFYPHNATHFERRWTTMVPDLTKVISSNVATVTSLSRVRTSPVAETDRRQQNGAELWAFASLVIKTHEQQKEKREHLFTESPSINN